MPCYGLMFSTLFYTTKYSRELAMNSAGLENLRTAAMELTEPERAKLASDLVASLDGPSDKGLSAAWDIEICRRINEIELNPSLLLDSDEVLARAKVRLNSH
jgi:putative addiction module component (TIGR02574 family)